MPSSRSYVAVIVLLALCGGIAACGGEQSPPTNVSPIENEAPAATISGPADGASFASGESIDFEGTGEDPEDGTLDGGSLVWTSDVDDELGEGSPVTRDDLSEGTHTITLTVTDSEGATGTASIELTIESNEAPTATISAPADGASFASGESIDFEGTGEDPEDGTLDGESLVWTSDVDDGIGEGSPVTRDDLSEGTHTITLTVTDSEGATGTASIQLTVESAAQADADGDGFTVEAGDCDDADASIHPDASDPIDALLVDSNCDGTDGDLSLAVLVTPLGTDGADCGTLEAPCGTLNTAVTRAADEGGLEVYIAGGTYEESVVLPDDVSLYGGFASDFSSRDPASHETAILGAPGGIAFQGKSGQAITVLIENHAGQTELADLHIVGRDAAPAGKLHGNNAYALVVRASQPGADVIITRNLIEAGNGSPGASGSRATEPLGQPDDGSPGQPGDRFSTTCNDTDSGLGGGGGFASGSRAGGRGGDGGTMDSDCSSFDLTARPGSAGDSGGLDGDGGPGGATCTFGGPGSVGADGFPGSNGAGGIGGDVSTGVWIASSGAPGGTGGPGHGGGGGGGAGGCDTDTDSYGAGGGGGGAGGLPATDVGGGGYGGGGSFGIYIVDASPSVTLNEIIGAAGGRGGDGGDGAPGQPGGRGGDGGLAGASISGPGGDGGDGGRGGASGAGGGGAGGASIGIAILGSSSPELSDNSITLGSGGQGGLGGHRPYPSATAGTGGTGLTATIHTF